MSVHTQAKATAGDLLREWRHRRRLSQLELAGQAATSARHVSFVETGRATPSRALLLHLCEHLDVPLRERNRVLLAAGYAPVYASDPLESENLSTVRAAIRQVLTGHEPYPAVAVDHGWHLVDANAGLAPFVDGVAPELLAPPVNVLRLSLHPDGMGRRILNLAEWRAHLFGRLQRQIDITASVELIALYEELRSYPGDESGVAMPDPDQVVVPLRLRHGDRELRLSSTMTVFGTPLNVTLAELAIESFFPADPETARVLRGA